MSSFDKSLLAKYFFQKVAVVKVKDGESQEEAWRRYLLSHPENASANIKIFHYLNESSCKPGNKEIEPLRFK